MHELLADKWLQKKKKKNNQESFNEIKEEQRNNFDVNRKLNFYNVSKWKIILYNKKQHVKKIDTLGELCAANWRTLNKVCLPARGGTIALRNDR